MKEWKEYKLGDIVVLNYGKSLQEYKRLGGKIPVYSSAGITGWHNDPLINDAGIIIGRKGTIGSVYYSDKPFFAIDTTYYISRNDEKYNLKFLYYLLLSLGLETLNEDSAVPGLNRNTAYSQDILLPPLPEQKAIAEVLSSLDDKIDLLHRQNKTLEQLAETLFSEKLKVNSEKWEEKPLSSLIIRTLGGEWGKEEPEGEFTKQVCCLRGTDIADLQSGLAERVPIRFIKEKKFESISPKDGDLILEISGGTDDQSTGRTIYINELNRSLFPYPPIFSNFCRLLRPIRKEYSYFLYLYIQYLYKKDEFFNLENGSSGIKNLDYKYLLNDLKFLLPNNESEILEFDMEVRLYFEKINKNKHQIRTLTQLRDTLLPKLMSGEVRVNIKDTITI